MKLQWEDLVPSVLKQLKRDEKFENQTVYLNFKLTLPAGL